MLFTCHKLRCHLHDTDNDRNFSFTWLNESFHVQHITKMSGHLSLLPWDPTLDAHAAPPSLSPLWGPIFEDHTTRNQPQLRFQGCQWHDTSNSHDYKFTWLHKFSQYWLKLRFCNFVKCMTQCLGYKPYRELNSFQNEMKVGVIWSQLCARTMGYPKESN